jgi:alkylation response protein AidB-like acyl-CoA dehydrogenase
MRYEFTPEQRAWRGRGAGVIREHLNEALLAELREAGNEGKGPLEQALQEAVERFCREQVTPERLRAWEREPRGIDAGGWRAIADLGWFGLGLPEAHGGSGFGLVEVACLLQECARGLIPRSVIKAIRGGWALAQLDPHAAELADVARGACVVALAYDEQSASDPSAFATTAQSRTAAVEVTGEKWYVPNGLSADLHIVGG